MDGAAAVAQRPHRAAPGAGHAGGDGGAGDREGEALAHVGRWDVGHRAPAPSNGARREHRIHGIEPPDFEGDLRCSRRRRTSPPTASASRARAPEERAHRPGTALRRRSTDIVRPDAEVRPPPTARAEPTIGPTGAVVGLRGIGHDITEDELAVAGSGTPHLNAYGELPDPLDEVIARDRLGPAEPLDHVCELAQRVAGMRPARRGSR